MYSQKVRAILERAGWYEGRKIDISEKVAKLEECGFEVFDKAKEFLQEFDELKLEETEPFYPKTYGIEPTYDIFDVKWFIDILLKKPKEERKQYIEHWFTSCDSEERNIPIGSLSAWEVYLFITESGRIVTDISLIGNSIEEGVSNVIQNYGCGFLSDNIKKLYNNDI